MDAKTTETRRERAKRILDEVAAKVMDGGAVKYIKENLELFADEKEIPCCKWSRLNRLMVSLENTNDARGIRQWNKIGRSVKKGRKAFYIFVPMFRTEKDDVTDEEQKCLSGFRLMPVFKVEDTEGKELPYQVKMKQLDVDKLPLIEVARKLGVKVGKKATSDGSAGYYRPRTREIMLNSSHPQVFLHELSHAVDFALGNYGTDYAFGEVVAELSSAFLGSLYGIKVDLDNTKAYIQGWAGKEHVTFKVLAAMERVEKIYRYIDDTKNDAAVTETVIQPQEKCGPASKTETDTDKESKPEKAMPNNGKEKKEMSRKERIPKKEGGNFMLPFSIDNFKNRSQTYNVKNGKWVKRDMMTGRFTAVKKDGRLFNRIKFETNPNIVQMPDIDGLPPAA